MRHEHDQRPANLGPRGHADQQKSQQRGERDLLQHAHELDRDHRLTEGVEQEANQTKKQTAYSEMTVLLNPALTLPQSSSERKHHRRADDKHERWLDEV